MRRFFLGLVVAVAVLAVAAARPTRAQDDGKSQDPPTLASVMAQSFTKILEDELGLTDDQAKKVSDALEKGMDHLLMNMATRADGGQADDDSVKDEIISDLRAVLDDGQQAQLEILVKEFETQTGRFELTDPNAIDPGNLLGDPDKAADPATKRAETRGDLWLEGDLPTTERLLLKAENALLLTQEEKKIVLPRIAAVVAARRALRERAHARRQDIVLASHGGAKQDELRDRLHALRNEIKELEERLANAEEALREVVTVDQEARLVAIGVLD